MPICRCASAVSIRYLLDVSVLTTYVARNRVLVVLDWLKSKAFGRDVSRE